MSETEKWQHNAKVVRALDEMAVDALESIVESNKMTEDDYRKAKHEALLRFVGAEVDRSERIMAERKRASVVVVDNAPPSDVPSP